jgi:hypothetical protein
MNIRACSLTAEHLVCTRREIVREPFRQLPKTEETRVQFPASPFVFCSLMIVSFFSIINKMARYADYNSKK